MWNILFNYIQLPHIIDEYGLNYVCPKAFSQKLYLNGFSPVWLCLCLVREIDWLNAFSQNIHWKGFSPVWLHLCIAKLEDVLNAFSQIIHLGAFSPVWLHSCLIKWKDCLNFFSQNTHLNAIAILFVPGHTVASVSVWVTILG